RDGFQATKDIRKIQEKTGKKSFIVALTAKTFVNPEQECLAAGMDEYLLKPLDMAKLNDMLYKFDLL
ncbi:MAG: response regulator, partial [Proteobacteria bacterium]|nr:response regulator [Pseudomonadota bacterium]